MKFDFESIFFWISSIILSIVVLLGVVIDKIKPTDEKSFSLKYYTLLGILYVLSGMVAFVLCLNMFYTPALQPYFEYKYVASMVFGGFGTLTIPAIHTIVEVAIEKAIRKAKLWAQDENKIKEKE